MTPVIEALVNLFFISSGFLCILSCENAVLHNWSVHGKRIPAVKTKDSTHSSRFLVSKQLFIHFYVVALIVNAAVFFWELFFRKQFNIFRVMFGFHVARRYLEQLRLFNRLPCSNMHFTAYLFGVSYYLIVPFALCNPANTFTKIRMIGFALSQYLQFKSHYILYTTKRASSRYGEMTYVVPTGGPFNYVLCPHYCSEIMAYLALSCNLEMLSCLLFVAIALTVQSLANRNWYKSLFLPYELHTVYTILPYVL